MSKYRLKESHSFVLTFGSSSILAIFDKMFENKEINDRMKIRLNKMITKIHIAFDDKDILNMENSRLQTVLYRLLRNHYLDHVDIFFKEEKVLTFLKNYIFSVYRSKIK